MTWLDPRVIEILAWTLLHSLWQIALVAAGAWSILSAIPRVAARTRYTLALAALVLMAASLPVTFYALAPTSAAVVPSPDTVVPAPAAAAPAVEQLLILDHPSHFVPAPVNHERPYLSWIVLAYAAGLSLALLRLFIGWGMTLRLRHGVITPALRQRADHLARRMGLRPVRITQHLAAQLPMVVGILRPIVVLPVTAATGLTAQQLDALLAHELAHLRRLDPLANFLQTLLETILFYHPAVWWISRVIRTERECCCDEIAVAIIADRPGYAGALAAMETLRSPAPVLSARGGDLSARIRRLLQRDPRTPSYAPAAALVMIVAIVVIIWGCAAPASPSAAAAPTTQPAFVTEQVHPFADLYIPSDGNPPGTFAEQRLQAVKSLRIFDTPEEARQAAANERTAAKLHNEINEVWSGAMTLDNTLPFIGTVAGINIQVNWKALEGVGIGKNTSISVPLRKVTAERAIRLSLQQASTEDAPLDYVIEDGDVYISTKNDLQSAMFQCIRVFDIRDLLVWSPQQAFALPTDDKPKPPTADEQKGWAEATTQHIINSVEREVDPDSWRDRGGTIGSIRELNGQLIINQVPEDLVLIGQVLARMRDANALQIAIESRVYILSGDRMAALVAKYPGAADDGHGKVLAADQAAALFQDLDADKSVWSQSAPRLTVFNNGVARVRFTDPTGTNNAFTEAVEATVSRDRKSAILQGILGPPNGAEIRPAPAAFATVPDGGSVLFNGGRINDKGSLGRVLWVVRPTLILHAPPATPDQKH